MTATDNLRALIDQMKAEQVEASVVEALEATPDDEIVSDYAEAPNPEAAVEIVKQITLLRVQKAAIEKAEKQLVAAAKVITGDHKGLRAGTMPLSKLSHSTVTRLNSEVIRNTFPPEKYPQFYTESEESRFLVDTAFKQQVITENSKELEG